MSIIFNSVCKSFLFFVFWKYVVHACMGEINNSNIKRKIWGNMYISSYNFYNYEFSTNLG